MCVCVVDATLNCWLNWLAETFRYRSTSKGTRRKSGAYMEAQQICLNQSVTSLNSWSKELRVFVIFCQQWCCAYEIVAWHHCWNCAHTRKLQIWCFGMCYISMLRAITMKKVLWLWAAKMSRICIILKSMFSRICAHMGDLHSRPLSISYRNSRCQAICNQYLQFDQCQDCWIDNYPTTMLKICVRSTTYP